MTTPMKRYWIAINLTWLLVVAVLGGLMRGTFTGATGGFHYEYALHTHSHVAFIGWVYQTLFVALVSRFLDAEQIRRGRYVLQLAITQILVVGMLAAFWLQGYAAASIALSSVFQVVSYWFAWRLWRDGREHVEGRHRFSWRFVQVSLLAMVLSSFGPWGLAAVVANGLQDSPYYSMAIYFYLHFQYNGWFVFGLLALLFAALESTGRAVTERYARWGFALLAVGLFPAYAMSIPHLAPSPATDLLAWGSGAAQVAGIVLLTAWGWRERERLGGLPRPWPARLLLGIAAAAMVAKFVLQLLSLAPGLAEITFGNRHVIIAFIHLVVLGGITFALLGLLPVQGLLRMDGWVAGVGVVLLTAGFLWTEWLLVAPVLGVASAHMFPFLYSSGILMACGIAAIWIAQFRFGRFA